MAIPGIAVFGRDKKFNLTSVVDWQVVTTVNQRQVEIDHVWENARQIMHAYAICDQIYVEMTSIYRKLDYKKQDPYRTIEVFTNSTVQVQQG